MIEQAAIENLLPAIKALAPSALKYIAKASGVAIENIRASFQQSFSAHLQVTKSRCERVRTILSNDQQVLLKSVYVNLHLKCGSKVISDSDLLRTTDHFRRIIIVGTGGAGKTMIMRYLALEFNSAPNGTIPIFVELRNLTKFDRDGFYRAIFDLVTPIRQTADHELFLKGLHQGIFTLLLDGFDEVPIQDREILHFCIQKAVLDYPIVKVIISTRPDIDTTGWNSYDTYYVQPLSNEQAISLITKVEFPETLKSAFIDKLTSGAFAMQATFVSIPLLCCLLLLTFSEYMEVPSRITVFYEQAFETLYRRHDRSKVWKRVHSSGLDADRFRLVFSAFCYRTLALGDLSFTDIELTTHLEKAILVSEIDVSSDAMATDLVSAVCLIMRDGLRLHFVHRSFQEYFAALFLLRQRGPNTFQVYSKVTHGVSNSAIRMAADIDLSTVEREWVLPSLSTIESILKDREGIDLVRHFLSLTISQISYHKKNKALQMWTRSQAQNLSETFLLLSQIYSTVPDLKLIEIFSSLIPKVSYQTLRRKGIYLVLTKKNMRDPDFSSGPDIAEIEISSLPDAWIQQCDII